jgi:hypothetical protein
MMIGMARPSESLVIGAAAFFAAGSLVVWFLERRKDRLIGRVLLLGVPGVYLSGLASFGAPGWLYIPGLTLLAAGYVVQVRAWRRRKRQEAGVSPSSASVPSDP